jgi:hypothetical protein
MTEPGRKEERKKKCYKEEDKKTGKATALKYIT